MTWLSEWRALAARIEGFSVPGELVTTARDHSPGHLMGGFMLSAADRLLKAVRSFHDRHENDLPEMARLALSQIVIPTSFPGRSSPTNLLAAAQVAATLRALRVELDHYFADEDLAVRRLVERAFLHLQRSLEADKEFRRRWKRANESKCETLGALHLLAHGIWAFKAHAVGARTDLILKKPLRNDEVGAADVEAFVLTEWKLADEEDDLCEQIADAHHQLRRYQGGALGGFELSTRRYVVIVSDHDLPLPSDHQDRGILCRHILLNRGDDTPSVSAKRRRPRK